MTAAKKAAPRAGSSARGARFPTSPEAYRKLAIETRQAYRALADMIESGADLTINDRRTIAAVLRDVAGDISTVQAKSKGAQPQFSHGSAALRWAWLRHLNGLSPTAATAQVAEEYDVSETAIKKVIKAHGEWAHAQFADVSKRQKT